MGRRDRQEAAANLKRIFPLYCTNEKLAEVFDVTVKTVAKWMEQEHGTNSDGGPDRLDGASADLVIVDELRRPNNDDAK